MFLEDFPTVSCEITVAALEQAKDALLHDADIGAEVRAVHTSRSRGPSTILGGASVVGSPLPCPMMSAPELNPRPVTNDVVVHLRGIGKSFGPVTVLSSVDVDVRRGEVHVLAGENGAGKSTLIKILAGVYLDYTGDLVLRGDLRRFNHPRDAVQAGIATIHQELSLVPTMSVADNLFLGRELTDRLGRVNYRAQTESAARILADAGLECSPHQVVGELSLADQQFLEVARALARDATLVVFDEPTSAMHEPEVEVLFERIDGLRRRGCGVMYITHKMDEIYRIADRITVLRDGRVVGTAHCEELPPATLVEWMVGRDLAAAAAGRVAPAGPTVLEVRQLRVAHTVPGRAPVADVSFDLRRGEILGLAGLRGSGATQVLHGLFGVAEGTTSGDVCLAGESLDARDPRTSIAKGLVLLAGDRKAQGLAPDLSVTHSVGLASLPRFSPRLGWMRRAQEAGAVGGLMRRLRLQAASPDAAVGTLSGGNQQKTYFGRCLLAEPRVLLLDEPSRGIDVGAKVDIYTLIRTCAAQGIATILVTTDLEELFALCDRILVLHRGRIAAEVTPETASRDDVLAAAMGGRSARTA